MTTQFVEKLIHSKMNVEQNEIIFTFYDLRIKINDSEYQNYSDKDKKETLIF